MKMRVKTSSKQFHYEDGPAENKNEKEVQEISNSGLDNEMASLSQPVQEISVENDSNYDADNMVSKEKEFSFPSPAKATSNEEEEYKVRCPCGCNEDDGLMVLCSHCSFWQHGICFLITDENKAPTHHICDICSKIPTVTEEPTDPYLKEMSSIAVQATCLWRRALSACLEFKRIMAPQLARRLGIEVTVAQGLINRLEKEGFVIPKSKGKKLGKTVDKEKIQNEGVPHYLKTPVALVKKLADAATINTEAMDIEIHRQDVVGLKEKENVKSKKKNDEMCVESLVEKTTKINIQEQKRNKGGPQSKTDATVSSNKSGSRKRAYSRIDTSEFELSNSQDTGRTRAKKKASATKKNIQI